MKYHPNVSPRSLSTVEDPLRGYPKHWELRWWYLCARKYPYPNEVSAAILAEERGDEYHYYTCPLDPTHWHIGRGDGSKRFHEQVVQAKRAYRKAVRDEIWRNYVVQQKERASG